jgi:hypothetical protein
MWETRGTGSLSSHISPYHLTPLPPPPLNIPLKEVCEGGDHHHHSLFKRVSCLLRVPYYCHCGGAAHTSARTHSNKFSPPPSPSLSFVFLLHSCVAEGCPPHLRVVHSCAAPMPSKVRPHHFFFPLPLPSPHSGDHRPGLPTSQSNKGDESACNFQTRCWAAP